MKNKHFLDDNKHLILDKLFSLNDFKCRIYIHYHALISRNQCSVKLIKKKKRLLTHSHVFISVYMWWGCLHFIWGDVCFDEFNFVLGILVSACEWWKSWSEKLGKYCTSHFDFESLLNNLNFILLIWYSFLNCIIKTILYLIMFDSSINFCYYFEQRKIWYILSYLNRCYWIYYRYIVFVLCPVHWYRIFCLFGQCFMNSVLQCLSNTKPLVEYFLRDDFTFDKNTTTSSMKGQLVTGMFRNHLPPVSLKIGEIHVLEIIIKDKKIIF